MELVPEDQAAVSTECSPYKQLLSMTQKSGDRLTQLDHDRERSTVLHRGRLQRRKRREMLESGLSPGSGHGRS